MESNISNKNSDLKKIFRDLFKEAKDIDVLYGEFKKIEAQANSDEPVTFILVGEASSGKTTLTNALIASARQTTNWSKMKILPSSSMENTYYFTIISNSQDENFHY